MFTLDGVLESLRLEQTGPNRYAAGNVQIGHAVVFGGQLLAQSVIAGLIGQEGKTVKTLQTVFARGASPDSPLDIEVRPLHTGRNYASSTVTISQAGRPCTQSTLLLSTDEADVIRHADFPCRWSPPAVSESSERSFGAWQVRVVGDVDVSDPEAVGPPELDVWARCDGAPLEPSINQALLAFLTEGFLIGAAMRPHRGVGQSQAHVTLSTGVLAQTLTFHEPSPAAEWLLLQQRSSYAGHGKSYGRGDVFREDGALVASYAQDSMIRRMPEVRKGVL
jgi:acyl-CoA thioesterase-2